MDRDNELSSADNLGDSKLIALSGDGSLSFEASLAALEAAVHDLEDGQLGLSESLERYEQSVKHLKRCYQLLEAAERKIELLTGVREDGTPRTEPFHEGSESVAGSAGKRRKPRSRAVSEPAATGLGDIDGSLPGT